MASRSHCGSVRSNERKNKTERERIAKKQLALHMIRSIIKDKGVVVGEPGTRWTEKYTLEQALELIKNLKASIREHGGNPNNVPLPMASRRRHHQVRNIIKFGGFPHTASHNYNNNKLLIATASS